jgi:hypothetical protein
MHKDLLERCTDYFEKNKLFDTLAAEKHIIFLNDFDPDAFGMFSTWAYTGLFLPRDAQMATELLNTSC